MPFEPNKPRPVPEWATFAAARTPMWKVHSSAGLARTAVSAKKTEGERVSLYHLVDGEWQLVLDYVPPTQCACGNVFQATQKYGKHWDEDKGKAVYMSYLVPKVFFVRKPIFEEEAVCYDCYRAYWNKKYAAVKEKEEKQRYEELKLKYGG